MSSSRDTLGRRTRGRSLALLALLLLSILSLPAPVHGAAAYPAITGKISGPTVVGRTLQAQYIVNGTGGPAIAANGTQVGNITYNATLTGNNVTSASVSPPTGVLVNGGVILRFTAPNLTEEVRLHVKLTSSYGKANASGNLTFNISVVSPYILAGVLHAGPTTVTGFNMTVTVDGVPVGVIVVPTMEANSTYSFSFDYVPESLSAGWHTISISLAPEHGLVTFQGGLEQYSLRFFISGAPPDYALDVGVGIAAFAVAVFIWGSVVGARRRGRRAR